MTRPGNLGQLYLRYRAIYLVGGARSAANTAPLQDYIADVIFFPVIDWHFRFQRPQHLATELAKLGYRVFYLASAPLIASRNAPYAIQESPADNVFVIQLGSGGTRLSNLYLDQLTDGEIAGFNSSLQRVMSDFSVKSPVAIVHHPFWYPVVANARWSSVVYDCIDHHAGFCDVVPNSLVKLEQLLVKEADVVTVSSGVLSEHVLSTRQCHIIRNGCEYARFAGVSRLKLTRTTIGYVGAISAWFDVDMLASAAKQRIDWDFVLVGSTVGADVSSLRRLSNVIFRGEIPYEQVPDQMASFDVCLIPFKMNLLTASTNPVKVYEYLAAGRPVVATRLPELEGLAEVDVFLADSSTQFLTQLDRALLVSDNSDRIKRRREWASRNDWSARALQMASTICNAIEPRPSTCSERESLLVRS